VGQRSREQGGEYNYLFSLRYLLLYLFPMTNNK